MPKKSAKPAPPTLSKAQQDLVSQLGTNLETGLSTDQAAQIREQDGIYFNQVDPPINCPAWICCLLPCIKSIPSMKTFRMIKPEDAEVLRDGHWVRYDATSLVKGDVIRLEEGDIVPADCVVLQVDDDNTELLVDGRYVTGELKPRSSTKSGSTQLFYGSHVVQGSGMAIVTNIGPNTLLARVIRDKRFPPTAPTTDILSEFSGTNFKDDEDPEAGISLVER